MDGFSGNRNRSKTPYAASPRPRFLLGECLACFWLFPLFLPFPVFSLFVSPFLSSPFSVPSAGFSGIRIVLCSRFRLAGRLCSPFLMRLQAGAIRTVFCRFSFSAVKREFFRFSGGRRQRAESRTVPFFRFLALFSGNRAFSKGVPDGEGDREETCRK